MLGFYIKHSQYNKYLGFYDKNKVWTDKDKAYWYHTQVSAESAARVIKKNNKYRAIKLIIVDRLDVEVAQLD